MTTYEHAMLGLTVALAAGAHRRHGWALPATTAIAAALPDWDAASLFFGADAYRTVHRAWGHNLLSAALLGVLTGGLGYLCYQSVGVRRRFRRFLDRFGVVPTTAPPVFLGISLVVWMLFGMLGGFSHLLADLLHPWPMPLLWPFDERRWAVPILPWGDMPPTLLFLGAMFTLYNYPRHAQMIAWLTLIVLSAYVAVRWMIA